MDVRSVDIKYTAEYQTTDRRLSRDVTSLRVYAEIIRDVRDNGMNRQGRSTDKASDLSRHHAIYNTSLRN